MVSVVRGKIPGKDKMTTFEHYFVEDKSTYKEVMNPYYQLSLKEEFCNRLLEELGFPWRDPTLSTVMCQLS